MKDCILSRTEDTQVKIWSNKCFKICFLFRLRSTFSTKIDALPLGSSVITMYDNMKVCIYKFILPSGEVETLMSDLFDLDESEFKDLYFKRWRLEVK